jgi:hypothetical protein
MLLEKARAALPKGRALIVYEPALVRSCWGAETRVPGSRRHLGEFRSRAGDRCFPKAANQSLSTVEPVSATPKWKSKNGEQRPALETRPAPKLEDGEVVANFRQPFDL